MLLLSLHGQKRQPKKSSSDGLSVHPGRQQSCERGDAKSLRTDVQTSRQRTNPCVLHIGGTHAWLVLHLPCDFHHSNSGKRSSVVKSGTILFLNVCLQVRKMTICVWSRGRLVLTDHNTKATILGRRRTGGACKWNASLALRPVVLRSQRSMLSAGN